MFIRRYFTRKYSQRFNKSTYLGFKNQIQYSKVCINKRSAGLVYYRLLMSLSSIWCEYIVCICNFCFWKEGWRGRRGGGCQRKLELLASCVFILLCGKLHNRNSISYNIISNSLLYLIINNCIIWLKFWAKNRCVCF